MIVRIVSRSSKGRTRRMSDILVIGATGQQGGAVTRALLEGDRGVVALVRNPDGPKEAQLAGMGVELRTGSLDDTSSIAAAASDIGAMFAMTTPYTGLDAEVRHGTNIADAAHAAGVPHLVFSSVAAAGEDTGIGHFDSKWEIEKHINELGLPATVIAPVFFMDNYVFPNNLADIAGGVLRQAVEPDTTLQIIASDDIGRFAALVLGDPDRFIGKRIEIAGDELTGPEIAQWLSSAVGHPVRYEAQPLAELDALGEDWRRMYEWFNETGWHVDRGKLAAEYPEVEFATLEAWAAGRQWDSLIQNLGA
jgi:uncharacterized protein YbjT (DUF2867 family)